MKKIEAIVRPYKVSELLEALSERGIGGATVVEATGFGRQKGHTEIYRGQEYQVDRLPKAMVIVYVSDDFLEAAVMTIQRVAHSGKIGDGKITVYAIENAVRIRTGEQGEAAL